jgi:mannose-6-phosphate isomerase-like protein (cupin superfamily)
MTKRNWLSGFLLGAVAIAGCSRQASQPSWAQPAGKNVDHVTVIHMSEQPAQPYPWGEIHWLMSNKLDPDAAQTFGIVRINPGQKNALHLHPNCEELLYVLSGDGQGIVGDKTVSLHPGDLLRVPAGVYHQATVTSTEPLVAVISYSSGDRQVINKGTQSE